MSEIVNDPVLGVFNTVRCPLCGWNVVVSPGWRPDQAIPCSCETDPMGDCDVDHSRPDQPRSIAHTRRRECVSWRRLSPEEIDKRCEESNRIAARDLGKEPHHDE